MAIIKKLRGQRGFTLIELMIVVVIIGILAAVAIYGVFRYIANSKTSEAKTFLGRMSKDAVTVFEGESMAGGVVTIGQNRASSRLICDDAADTVPSGGNMTTAPAQIAGRKYQSGPDEWRTGSRTAGWACLKSQLTGPQYYAYGYVADGSINPADTGATFTAYAVGNLDNDAAVSLFWIDGRVQQVSGDLVLTVAPSIAEVNAEE